MEKNDVLEKMYEDLNSKTYEEIVDRIIKLYDEGYNSLLAEKDPLAPTVNSLDKDNIKNATIAYLRYADSFISEGFELGEKLGNLSEMSLSELFSFNGVVYKLNEFLEEHKLEELPDDWLKSFFSEDELEKDRLYPYFKTFYKFMSQTVGLLAIFVPKDVVYLLYKVMFVNFYRSVLEIPESTLDIVRNSFKNMETSLLQGIADYHKNSNGEEY